MPKSPVLPLQLAIAGIFFFALSAPSSAAGLVNIMTSELGQSRPSGCPSKWCACYLDRMLEAAGFQTENSFRARDFAKYGKPAEPMSVGSIMVMPHHVGVVTGTCEDGRVELISGNHGHRVGLGCYNPQKAIAWRAPVR